MQNDNVTDISPAQEKANAERNAKMLSDAKIIAIQFTKLAVVVGAGIYIFKKLNASSDNDETVETVEA